jgi:hypothetical protein
MLQSDTQKKALLDYFDAMFLNPALDAEIPVTPLTSPEPLDTICASQRMCNPLNPFTSLDLIAHEGLAVQTFWCLLGLCQSLPDSKLRSWCVSLCGIALHKAWTNHGRQ